MSVFCGVVNHMFDCVCFGVMVFVCLLVLAAIVRRRASLLLFVRCCRLSLSFVVGCCLLLIVFVLWSSKLLVVVVMWCLMLLLVVVGLWSGVVVGSWNCALLVVCRLPLVGIICCCLCLRDVRC